MMVTHTGEEFNLLERMFQLSDKDKDGRLSVVRSRAHLLGKIGHFRITYCFHATGGVL